MALFESLFFACQYSLQSPLLDSRSRLNPVLTYIPAEGAGFEPTVPFGTRAFQARAFNRSATLPDQLIIYSPL